MKERSVMNNYFGIGIDAKIALDFHNKREETQNKSGKSSRAKNYLYALTNRNKVYEEM